MNEKERIFRKVRSLISDTRDRKSYIGDDDFVTLSKNGIAINYHIKNLFLDMENIFRAVKRAQNIVREYFDCVLERIEIDIFDSVYEMRQIGNSRSRYASWIAGVFDGKIRVIAERDDNDPDALYILLTHEIIHLAINGMSKGNCPYWLDEGLAVYLSQGLSDTYAERLLKSARQDKVLPLEILEHPLPPDSEETLYQLAYAQCASLTEFIVETYGWEAVSRIISQCTSGSMDAILADICLNYCLLELTWKRWFLARSA
jgi:hypothetical protein